MWRFLRSRRYPGPMNIQISWKVGVNKLGLLEAIEERADVISRPRLFYYRKFDGTFCSNAGLILLNLLFLLPSCLCGRVNEG